ncbi:MAG: hypothetical protein AB7S48_13880 [Bacteroidales bacterium]
MDAGDYIYIIIAIVLAIVNAVANKKKKEAAKQKAAMSESTTPMKDPAELLQEILTGKADFKTNNQPSEEDWSEMPTHSYAEVDEQDVDTDKSQPAWSYEANEDFVKSVEYEQPVVEVKEEKLYPLQEVTPIDVPDNAKFTPIDSFASIEDSISEYNYDAIFEEKEETESAPDMIFEHEKAMAAEEAKPSVLDDFDARKAIVYAEVMTPKYV